MEIKNIILGNKSGTSLLYDAIPSKLPQHSLDDLHKKLSTLTTDSVVKKNIPKAKSRETKYELIKPIDVIDERGARGKEKVCDIKPVSKQHKNWVNYLVVTGHNGWINGVDVDPTNEFFVTCSADRMIKIWKFPECQLLTTLTNHIGSVNDVCISRNLPYLYSVSAAKEVFNWDLTKNSIIRKFFGHFSGVYCVSEMKSSQMVVTGGRDSTGRVWDLRTRESAFVLEGHQRTVFDIIAQDCLPHVVTASMDDTIKLWDLRNGRSYATLTNHQKAIRALAVHPTLWCFISASPDSIFQWNGAEGKLFRRFNEHNAVINSVSINEDGVMITCGDDGSIKFWDFDSATCFQSDFTSVQEGSLQVERGILDSTFDITGTRFITVESDKTIKIWKEE